MSATTLIGWTDSTWSPWLGCRKISEGCVNCYITGTTPFRTRNLVHGGRREALSPAYWKHPVKWDRQALRDGRTHLVFPSLCDWLDDEVDVAWLAAFLELVRRTPNIRWQLLTKRPQNWRVRMEAVQEYAAREGKINLGCWVSRWWLGTDPHNVWIGVSTENQARADERIPLMFEIPAVLYFISAEPLLGQLNLVSRSQQRGAHYKTITGTGWLDADEPKHIGWIITGGESSRKLIEQPRPAHPDWFRFLREQAAIADVPFFFKQWGDYRHCDEMPSEMYAERINLDPWLRGEGNGYLRVGKVRAGNLLDGQTYEKMPEVAR